jgi:hypothetical protein
MKINSDVLYNVQHVHTTLLSSRENRGPASMETAHRKYNSRSSFLFSTKKYIGKKENIFSNHQKKPMHIFCYGKKR